MQGGRNISLLLWGLLLPTPAFSTSPVVDHFDCMIAITAGIDSPFRAALHLASVRKESQDLSEGLFYQEPGSDLEAVITTPSGYVLQLLALFIFKRPAATPDRWGLHTCLAGYSQNPGENPDGWACPELYFPVATQNGVPLFDRDSVTFGQELDRDGRHITLSCTHLDTIY